MARTRTGSGWCWNWTDDALFRPVPATDEARAVLGHRGRCTVMFAGNIGLLQGIETAIRAAAAARDLIDLVLVGSGAGEEAARRLAADLGADNVRFVGRRPAEQMAELYAAADWQLVCLRDLPALRGSIPSKLQAALACGSPVIASVGGDAAALVRSAGVGLVSPPGDWRALAARFCVAAAESAGRPGGDGPAGPTGLPGAHVAAGGRGPVRGHPDQAGSERGRA